MRKPAIVPIIAPVIAHVKTICLAAAVLALSSMGSNAALLSGPDLLKACEGNATAKATCDGYLMAVTDLVLQREARGRGKGKLCVPETVTIGQVRESVLDFVRKDKPRDKPVAASWPAPRMVTASLRTTWPCDDAPRKKGRGKRDGTQE